MFKGKFYHTLDAKNRTIVPSKLRDELGDTFVITVGLEEQDSQTHFGNSCGHEGHALFGRSPNV